MDELDAILSLALNAVPGKSDKDEDSGSDMEMPPVDPMLLPFGNEAEEEMRKKLKKRMKKMKKEKKEKKRKKKSKSPPVVASGPKSVVKPIVNNKIRHQDPPPDPRRFHDGYSQMNNHRSRYDNSPPPGPSIPSAVKVVDKPAPLSPPSVDRWPHDRYEPWGAAYAYPTSRTDSPPPKGHSPPRRYSRNRTRSPDVARIRSPSPPRRSNSRYSHRSSRGPPSPTYSDYRSREPSSGRGFYVGKREYHHVPPPGPRSSLPPPPRGGRGRQYTGYGFHRRSRSRSPPPIPDDQLSMSSRPSPPKDMPEHIRWLHDRWRRYDKNFFKKGSDMKTVPAAPPPPAKVGTGANTEPLAERRKFSEERAPSQKPELTGAAAGNPNLRKYAIPYYQFRKGGEYHWNPGRMLGFKEFLLQQPEDIENQDEAVKLYTEYKLTFRQKALGEFFQAHAEDEWFLEKYHPMLKQNREQRRQAAIERRLDVFMQLLVRGWMEVPLERRESRKVRKLMDAAIVLLEGGDEGDIACLNDLDYILEEKKEESYEVEKKHEEEESEEEEETDLSGKVPGGGRTQEEQKADEEIKRCMGGPEKTDEELELMQHARDYSLYIKEHKEKLEAELENAPDNIGEAADKIEMTKEYTSSGVFISHTVAPKPLEEMNLHKVSGVIIKNIPTSVPRAELEEMCASAHGGFLRVHLSEPEVANQYSRTALVSFWYNANLQKILWKIRGARLRGENIVVLEYREFKRRIDCIDGLSGDKSVVLRDIQLCKSLIEYLDRRYQLWADAPGAETVCDEQHLTHFCKRFKS